MVIRRRDSALCRASMAGLPGRSAIVWVGPPLLARGPSRGPCSGGDDAEAGKRLVAHQVVGAVDRAAVDDLLGEVGDSRRAGLAEDAVVDVGGRGPEVDAEVEDVEAGRDRRRVLRSPAAPWTTVLPEKVLLVTVMVPLWLNSPPPSPLPAVHS